MSANISTFEVRIRTKGQLLAYHDYHGEYKYSKMLKMLHIVRRTAAQAIAVAKKHGEVVSCRKVDIVAMVGNIENIKLEQSTVYEAGNPYKSALAMDDMVWKKRNKRLDNSHKDKNNT